MAACSESSLDNSQNNDSSFVWDETSHLYFHGSGHGNMYSPENPPPPSEWLVVCRLEDTLIELYLLGYSNQDLKVTDDVTIPFQMDEYEKLELPSDTKMGFLGWAPGNTNAYNLEEGEWFPKDYHGIMKTSENISKEALVKGSKKDVKGEVMRLVGRMMRKSTKLHPSMLSSSYLLRTAPICESPSVRFLASLSVYDSSNPTKDWGFPELSLGRQLLPLSKLNRKKYAYRDRVAKRRALHGGFGVDPSQKISIAGPDGFSASTVSSSTKEAATEALNMSFGVGSNARRILENMGWKQLHSLNIFYENLGENGNYSLGEHVIWSR
ncbi:hypothetical protein UlMin_037626 [Ulmus minor]